MVYRPDIDGIRAIAVLSVVVYHLNPTLLPGGFIGVDIFFVISGYLITGVIQDSLDKKLFSISTFYERRIRRLLPALASVVIATTITSHLFLLPTAYSEFGQSLVATGLFSSNILFFLEHGYFDGPSELKPLLHTWSLSVEEQFYIVFPVLLLMLNKLEHKNKYLIIVASLIFSLCLCIVLTPHSTSMAFYFPFTRAWELLFGSILFYLDRRTTKIKIPYKLLSSTGLATIIFSLYFINSETLFPSFYAILPVLGTCLLIYGGRSNTNNLVSNIISTKIIVFTGKISYSLYLIHWPVLVFTNYYLLRELKLLEQILLLIFIYLLAGLSWQFIERPFRNPRFGSKALVIGSALITLSGFIVTGLAINNSEGYPNRLDEKIVLLSKVEKNPWRADCLDKTSTDIKNNNFCVIGNKSNVNIAIIGDSHADAIIPGLVNNIDLNLNGVAVFTKKGCRPFMNAGNLVATAHNIIHEDTNLHRETKGLPTNVALECGSFMDESYKIIKSIKVSHLIIHARWSLQYFGSRKNRSSLCYSDQAFPDCSIRNNRLLFNKYLVETISLLPDISIGIIGPVPEYSFPVPDVLGRSILFDRQIKHDLLYTNRGNSVSTLIQESVANTPHIHYLNVYSHFCNNGTCTLSKNGKSYYNDASHLSLTGSLALQEPIKDLLVNMDYPIIVD